MSESEFVVRVPFHGQHLEAVRHDGRVWVSIRRVCDALGLSADAQRVKLQDKPWATTAMIAVVAEDLKRRELAMIDLDSLPMWLATIEPARVAPESRERLELYQVEAARVLRDHFFGRPSAPAKAPLGPYTRRVMDAWRTQGSVPDGYWCVFAEGASVLILAELVFAPSGLEMQQYDLLDGSIGRHWADHRRDRPWAGERVRYRHAFPPGDPRGRVQAWAYPMAEVGHFKGWLRHDYLPTHFPAYLERKYGLDRLRLAAPEMARRGLTLRLPALQAGPAG